MGKDHQRGRGQEPAHARLAQAAAHEHMLGVPRGGRGLVHAKRGQHEQGRQHQPHGRRPGDADAIEQRPRPQHHQHEADRSPYAQAAVAACGLRVVTQAGGGQRLGHGHLRRHEEVERKHHDRQPDEAARHQKSREREGQRQAGGAQDANALRRVVRQPAPEVGANHPHALPDCDQHANLGARHAAVAEPQREVGREQARQGKVGKEEGAEPAALLERRHQTCGAPPTGGQAWRTSAPCARAIRA